MISSLKVSRMQISDNTTASWSEISMSVYELSLVQEFYDAGMLIKSINLYAYYTFSSNYQSHSLFSILRSSGSRSVRV